MPRFCIKVWAIGYIVYFFSYFNQLNMNPVSLKKGQRENKQQPKKQFKKQTKKLFICIKGNKTF